MNTVRIEAQMRLSRVVMEERTQKDIAVQQTLAQARAEMQEKLDSLSGVTSDDKVTYQVTWAQPSGSNHMESIMDGEQDDSDKEKE